VGLRIGVVAGWVAVLAVILFTGLSPFFAVPVTVVAGALVGRWWVLLVPAVIAAAYGLALLIRGGRGDSEPIVYAFALAFAAASFAFLLAVGVALRKLWP
jgi:hypothetical protein